MHFQSNPAVERPYLTNLIGSCLVFHIKGRCTISISGSQIPGLNGTGGSKQVLQASGTHPQQEKLYYNVNVH